MIGRIFSFLFKVLRALYPRKTVNFLLSLSVGVLLILFISFFFRFTFNIPQSLVERIEAFVNSEGFYFTTSEVSFCFDGTLTAKNFELGLENSRKPILKSKEASLKIDMFKILSFDFEPRFLTIKSAEVYSTFGASAGAPVLDNFSLFAKKSRANLNILSCSARLGNLMVFTSADISLGGLEKFLSENFKFDLASEKEGDYLAKWDLFCDKIYEFEQFAPPIKNPSLRLDILLDSNADFEVSIEATSDGISKKFDDFSFSLSKFRIFAHYDFSENKDGFNFSADASNISTSLELLSDRVSLSGFFNFKQEYISNLSVSAFDLIYKGTCVDSISVSKEILSRENLWGKVSSFIEMDDGDIFLKADIAENSAEILYDAHLKADEIFKCKLIPEFDELKWFSFKKGIFLNGQASLKFNGFFKNLDLKTTSYIDFTDALALNIDVESAFAFLSFDLKSGDFWAREIDIKTREGWSIGGDVYQNPYNYDYAFMLRGNMRPMAIAHFMDPWWAEVFKDIGVDKDFPYVDILVESRWFRPEIMYVYGLVDGKNLKRGGVNFEKANMFVWVTPLRISIYDLFVSNEDRYLSGMLEWTYPSKVIDAYDENRIVVESTLNQRELIGMGGERVEKVSKFLTFKNAPKLALTLYMPNPERYKNPIETFNLTCDAKGEVRASKFNLQDLTFEAYSKANDIFLNKFSATCAQGKISGSLNLLDKNDRTYFEGELSLENANQADFLKQLYELTLDEGDMESLKKYVASENSQFGVLSGFANLKGFTDDAKSISGIGEGSLTNPKLANINLFGAISKVAKSMQVPLGSFDFNKAILKFEISNSIIDLDNLKVYGPSAEISGSALYNFISDGINAKLMFKPFASISVPVVSQVFNAVNPLLSTIQIDIKNTYASPEVSLKLRPLNIFRSDKRIIERFSDGLDDEIDELTP